MNTIHSPPSDFPAPLEHASAWAALGVQHAILSRAMPVVRHDLAGMLTIMRMGAVVLRRRAGSTSQGDAADPLVTQLEQLEEQLASLSESARRLRHWDLQGPHAPEPLQATVQLAMQLSQPLLAMRGMQLELAPQTLPAQRVPQQPLLCLLLGAIHWLAEAPGTVPARIHIASLAGATTGLRVQSEGALVQAPGAAATPGIPPLSGPALAHLASHLGGALRWGDHWVEIDAPLSAQAAAPPAASA